MNRQLVAELESVLRSSSARSLSATAGGTNYAAQAHAVAAYLAPLLCADCADDLSDSVTLLVESVTVTGSQTNYVLSVR